MSSVLILEFDDYDPFEYDTIILALANLGYRIEASEHNKKPTYEETKILLTKKKC